MSANNSSHVSTAAIMKLQAKLTHAGVDEIDLDAAISYSLTWSTYGFVAGYVLGLGASFSIAMLISIVSPRMGLSWAATPPGYFIVWLALYPVCAWWLAIALKRHAARLQLRRIAPNSGCVLPPMGWLAISGYTMTVWVQRAWLPTRVSPTPACRVPIAGWSLTVPEGFRRGTPQTLIICDPAGTQLPIAWERFSDVERVHAILNSQEQAGS